MLKAFTIVELMVVCVLSAICVGAGFSAFQIIDRQLMEYNLNTSLSLEVSALYSLLRQDFINADLVLYEEPVIYFKHSNHYMGYKISGASIIRQPMIEGVLPDTFQLKPTYIHATYGGLPVQEGIVDQVDIKVLSGADEFVFSFSKQYSSQQKINNTYGN